MILPFQENFHDITDYRKFVEMIKALGFTYVNEVSFGVDLVAARYKELFEDFKGKYHITANCPAVVSHIEKYYPHLITNLAPIVSPMIATGKGNSPALRAGCQGCLHRTLYCHKG